MVLPALVSAIGFCKLDVAASLGKIEYLRGKGCETAFQINAQIPRLSP